MAKIAPSTNFASNPTPLTNFKTQTPGAPATPSDLPKLKRYFDQARDLTYDARNNSLVAQDYYDSIQFTGPQLKVLAERNQPPLVINRIKPAINSLIGITEKGRSDPKCWPRNPGTEDQADAATDVLRFIADFNRFKRLKQDCFRDMLVCGTTAALMGVDQDKQVTITQIRWEEFFYDPRSRRQDFRDARYLGVAKWMYQDDAAALYPEKATEIGNTIQAASAGGLPVDQSYQDRPEAWPSSGVQNWVDTKQRRIMVVEMYYRETTWRRCVFTGSDILEEGDSPYKDHKGRADCPIEAMSAYVTRENARYGAVWDMIGPQDEINKRRSAALWRLVAKQVEVADSQALQDDIDVARKEAGRPDGVLPIGYRFADNKADVAGQLELLQEAKGEIERMSLSPAMVGRLDGEHSGRALLARQQGGLVEFANLFGALEDFELRVYRQCWGRVKQFWDAPQFIRVTDDENAPKFVGLNQPIPGGPPTVGQDPQTGLATVKPGVLGYKNRVAEMDVDIEIDAQADTGTIQQEQFDTIMQMVQSNPNWQQQMTLAEAIQLSTIPHKSAVLDAMKQRADAQAQAQQAQQQLAMQGAQAKVAHVTAQVGETVARTGLHKATAFSKTLDSLAFAHQAGADHTARGLEAGLASSQAASGAQQDQDQFDSSQDAQAQGQQAQQAHEAAMAQQQQQAQAPDSETGGQ